MGSYLTSFCNSIITTLINFYERLWSLCNKLANVWPIIQNEAKNISIKDNHLLNIKVSLEQLIFMSFQRGVVQKFFVTVFSFFLSDDNLNN